ncbi:MAG: response regulator [Helicobacteraceae bacterium]|jgi:PAS domain S-box-containing protein|nr:response regulator [Helicobacteraceae bacterium]
MESNKAYYKKRRLKRILFLIVAAACVGFGVFAVYSYRHVFPSVALLCALVIGLIVVIAIIDYYMAMRDNELMMTIKLLDDYRRLIDQGAYVAKTNYNGVIIYVNDRTCDRCGYSREELVGHTHALVRHPDTTVEFYREMWRTILIGRVWSGVIKNRDKAGKTYFVNRTIMPIFNHNGKIVEFMALSYDVTALQNALTVANEAQEAKDRFLATMSHEIRTPLNAILGFIELLRERIKDYDLIGYVDTISRSSRTLLNIINDVLDFVKINSDKLVLEQRACNLRAEILNTITLFSANADAKNVLLSEVWSDPFPECVITDPIRIGQIVSNLLSNAIKFTPSGKQVVFFASFNEQTQSIEFAVEDEGIGISPEWQQRIFSPFSQVRSSDATQHGGTGLGLSISLKLANMMGGNLSVSSQEGIGSVFTLTLPVLLCRSEKKTDDKPVQFDGKARRVLIAEDQPDNQMLIKLLFNKMDFVAHIVNNGKEAVDSFTSESFDLVLLDENMPIMSGTQALKIILEYERTNLKQHTPIAVLTANAIVGDRERFLALGFDEYLSKPIVKKELYAVLEILLGD